MNNLIIYMKSGNVIKFKCKNLSVYYEKEKIVKMSWTNCYDKLEYIDITNIEAIITFT